MLFFNPGSQDIGTFQLLPGSAASKVCDRFVRYDMQGSNVIQSYEALSYQWSTVPKARTIHRRQNPDFRMIVSRETVLQMLQPPNQAQLIWIDAISTH